MSAFYGVPAPLNLQDTGGFVGVWNAKYLPNVIWWCSFGFSVSLSVLAAMELLDEKRMSVFLWYVMGVVQVCFSAVVLGCFVTSSTWDVPLGQAPEHANPFVIGSLVNFCCDLVASLLLGFFYRTVHNDDVATIFDDTRHSNTYALPTRLLLVWYNIMLFLVISALLKLRGHARGFQRLREPLYKQTSQIED